ncbi:MAG: LysR family transcriptional regulator [bacterium]|nr:LysR family transcriptional regulator [bacterium]
MNKQPVNLTQINLNLIVILDSLLREKNTTRSGRKLHISQSSISKALKQLREIFEDELLVRGHFSSEMSLTPMALELIEPVSKAIKDLNYIFIKNEFIPTTSDRHFKIGFNDTCTSLVLSTMLKKIANTAPHVKISVINMIDFTSYKIFEKFGVDLIVGYYPKAPASICTKPLAKHSLVCIADKKNRKITKAISIEKFFKQPHIVITHGKNKSINEGTNELYSDFLKRYKVKNFKYTEITHTLAGISVIKDSDFISIVPERIAEKFSPIFNLKIIPLPYEHQKIPISMYWKPENSNSASHQWLMNITEEAFNA